MTQTPHAGAQSSQLAALAAADRTMDDDLTERLAGVVADMLSNFYEPGHPGEPCRRTGWVPERSLKAWRAVYAEWADQVAPEGREARDDV